MEEKRKPCHCPVGHNCEDHGVINGLLIMCDICNWVDDSTYTDLTRSKSFVTVPIRGKKDNLGGCQ